MEGGRFIESLRYCNYCLLFKPIPARSPHTFSHAFVFASSKEWSSRLSMFFVHGDRNKVLSGNQSDFKFRIVVNLRLPYTLQEASHVDQAM